MSSAVPRVCHSFVACRDRPCNIRSHFAQALQSVGSICHFFGLECRWLSMTAKQAGSAHLSSVAGKCLNTRPIYPAWFEEHITEAQKTKFKEYAAAKDEVKKARQVRASKRRDRDRAQSEFDEAVELLEFAQEDMNDKKRSCDNIRTQMFNIQKRAKSDPYMGQCA